MVTLSIDVDEAILESAKSAADRRGTSIDALVVEYLQSVSAGSRTDQREAVRRIIELADASRASSGPEGITWKREDLYDRYKPS